MGELVFKISGVDFTPHIIEDGLKPTENDIDSDDAGMLMNGLFRRSRIAVRYHIPVTTANKLISTEEKNKLMEALRPQWVDVETNIIGGEIVTIKCYCSKRAATPVQRNGKMLWRLEPFSLAHEGRAATEL